MEPAPAITEGVSTNEIPLAPLADTSPPAITARLATDTGVSNSDRVTIDPTIVGSVADASAIVLFRAGFDAMPVGQYAEVSSRLLPNGTFLFDPDYLDVINIVPLADGLHALHLLTTDSQGNQGAFDLSFTLDTTPPSAPSMDLLASSDSGVSGNDNITDDTTPTLAVTRETETTASILDNGLVLATLPAGTLTATLGPLAPGAYAFQGVALDAAGNQSALSIGLNVTIDSLPPDEPGFDLDPVFAVGPPKVARAIVASTDAPQFIQDRGGTLSTTMVQGLDGTIFDLNVQLNLAHGSLQDLDVTLLSPSGTAVTLFSSLNGTTMIDTVFDDESVASIAPGRSPLSSRYRPTEPFALFDGEDPNGLWTLAITDSVTGFSGVLNWWSLILRTQSDAASPAKTTPVTIQGWTDPLTSVRLVEIGAVTTSGTDGNFSFSGLSVGMVPTRYTIEASDGAGNVSSFAHDLILRNERAVLQGVKFEDQDGDGLRDSGEPGLAGWTVELIGYDQPAPGATSLPPGHTQLTASTGTDGRFIFADLDPGIYVLREVLQPGWTQLAPAGTAFHPAPVLSGAPWLPDPLPDGAHVVQVGAFEIVSGLDFGNARFGSIAGTAFHDFDLDGTKDPGEPGLAGWTIYLDANNNGSRDAGERTRVTDAQGAYRWDDLRPEAYVVREEVPAGWRQTTPSSGGYSLTLPGGQVVTDRNFGAVQLGSLRGEQFDDVNGNGTRDVGEPGLAGWTLYLDTNGNGLWDAGESSTVTDADGAYIFPDLFPGSYRVAEEVPAGWVQTFPRLQPPGPTVGPAGLGLVHSDVVETPLVLPDELLLADIGLSLEAAGPADSLTRLDAVLADPRFADLDGRGITVAVIDTGIDVDHPFFGPDLNADGIADRLIAQFDFANGDADAGDHNGHGSHIASLIGSQDAANRGVAPGVSLIALKVFEDSGAGQFSYLEQALQWVIANAAAYGIDVVNMSLGDGGNWTDAIGRYGLGDELAGIANLGILEIAAAGNSFFSVGSAQGLAYPAADPDVIAAGAVWSADFGGPFSFGSGARDVTTGPDRIASFSQRHETLLDVFAPGARFTGANQNGGTTTLQGTSQASAYLSGIAVLAQELAQQELGRSLAPSEFVDLVRTTGHTIVDGDDENDNVANTGLTFPRVDALSLMNAILAITGPGPGSGTGGGGDQAVGGALVGHSLTLSPGQHLVDLDFGNFRLGEIRGQVFHDVNVDGLFTAGEAALAGWTVYLDANQNGLRDPTDRSATTDAAGAYRFSNIGPGHYVVRLESSGHWAGTVNAAGTAEFTMTSGSTVSDALGTVLITLDVDGDGTVGAFTDGRLLSRVLAGVSDAQLMAGSATGLGAARNSATAVRTYLTLAQSLPTSMLDADGNGTVQSATDGKLILRYMAGVSDTQLIMGGAIGPNAANPSAASVRSFLDSFQPPAPASAPSAQPVLSVESQVLSGEPSASSEPLASNVERQTSNVTGPSAPENSSLVTRHSSPVGLDSAPSTQTSASPAEPHSLLVTVPMGYAASLSLSLSLMASPSEDQPLLSAAPAWLSDFVVSSAVLTDDPNRDLAVVMS